MTTQHTPGPWEVTETFVQKRRAIGWAEGTVAYTAIPPEGDKTELADARLIAAAPELLEALQEQVAECFDPLCDMCARHQAIILKATGEPK